MRLGLAIRSFFAVLFKNPLPFELLLEDFPKEFLPEPAVKQLAAAHPPPEPKPPKVEEKPKAEAKPKEEKPKEEKPKEDKPKAPPKPDPATFDAAAVQVLAVLQSEGRLLDFLSEAIDGYSDEDVGAAVRDVHRGLKRAIDEHFPVDPLRAEEEDAQVEIPPGFDPHAVRLVGNVVGEPPFSGTLKHRGWKVRSVKLPRLPEGDAAKIAAPAEVEL